ncbi:MAG TPA: polymer-forming cytoskeletal protein [Acidobacteriaceae bacterium]|nr:polymer-forming cytoskeletal protein [Acidobacteriaceae bacterium]
MPVSEGTTASIGKSVQIFGELKGSEDLVVDGTIEGTITLSGSRLTIGPNAHVKANVSARDVVILGTLNGDINASGRVELRAGANLKGDIHAARLSIEENAVLSGKVDLTTADRPAANPPVSASPALGTASI